MYIERRDYGFSWLQTTSINGSKPEVHIRANWNEPKYAGTTGVDIDNQGLFQQRRGKN